MKPGDNSFVLEIEIFVNNSINNFHSIIVYLFIISVNLMYYG